MMMMMMITIMMSLVTTMMMTNYSSASVRSQADEHLMSLPKGLRYNTVNYCHFQNGVARCRNSFK
jgi:hypothetical protein